MKRKWNRMLSWLLSLTMLLGSFSGMSLPVLADGEEEIVADASVSSVAVQAISVNGAAAEKGSSAEDALSVSVNEKEALTLVFSSAVLSGNEVQADTVSWNLVKTGEKELADLGFAGTESGNVFNVSANEAVSGNGSFKLTASYEGAEQALYFDIVVNPAEAPVEPPVDPVSKNVVSILGNGFTAGNGGEGDDAYSLSISTDTAFTVYFEATVVSGNGELLTDKTVNWQPFSENTPDSIKGSENGNIYTVSGQSAVSGNYGYKLTATSDDVSETVFFVIKVGNATDPSQQEEEEIFWSDPVWDWTGTTSQNAVVKATFTTVKDGQEIKQVVTIPEEDVWRERSEEYTDENGIIRGSVTYKARVRKPQAREWEKTYFSLYTIDYTGDEIKEGEGRGGVVLSDGIEVILYRYDYDYTGAAIIPEFDVFDNSTGDDMRLIKGVDYTASCQNNKKPGKAKLFIKGKGNYAGKSKEIEFQISDHTDKNADWVLDLKGAKITNKFETFTYNGEEQRPAQITIRLKNKTELSYTWSDEHWGYVDADNNLINAFVNFSGNRNKGTATMLITGKNGTFIKKAFKIAARNINDVSINMAEDLRQMWAVKAEKVWFDAYFDVDENHSYWLTEGQDYTATYSAPKADADDEDRAGTMTLTGKGNFTGKKVVKYHVDKLVLEDGRVVVTAVEGKKVKDVKVQIFDFNGNIVNKNFYKYTLKSADGTTELQKKDKLGTDDFQVVITLTDKGKEAMETQDDTYVEYVKPGKDLSKVNIKPDKKYYITYVSNGVWPSDEDFVKGKIDPAGLTVNEHFFVYAVSGNEKKGTMKVVLRGIGEYTGTKTIKIKVVAKDLVDAKK